MPASQSKVAVRPRQPSVAKARETGKTKVAELHILAMRDINTVAELSGRVVSFGPQGGPGEATARRAFSALGIKVEETPLDFANAVDGVASGDVAALVTVEAEGSSRLRHLPGAKIHLLAVPPASAPPEGMRAATIPARIYPALSRRDVATFATGPSGKDKGTQSALLSVKTP